MITYEVQVTENLTKWYINGKLHREDGPAAEHSDGSKEWYINGKLHREDGPAIEHSDGYKVWYINGERHREDGPAIEDSGGDKYWFINGVELTEAAFNSRTAKPCTGKVIEVDGVKYKLTAV